MIVILSLLLFATWLVLYENEDDNDVPAPIQFIDDSTPSEDTEGLLEYPLNDETGSLHQTSSKKENIAVIHMGPHKTGTTTVQKYIADFLEELEIDGYYETTRWVKQIWDGESLERLKLLENQVQFASCFLPPDCSHRKEHPCEYELLLASSEIGVEGKNLLVSAEDFDCIDDDGLKALAAHLVVYDETIVSLFYRRFFEWLPSKDNQARKKRTYEDIGGQRDLLWASSIVDIVQTAYELNEVDSTYIAPVIQRVEQHFDHIEVVNMHDDKDNNEVFFCQVIPHADHTCTAMREEGESKHANSRVDLIYEDLAYSAMKAGLVEIKNAESLTYVTDAIKEHQEVTLNLTSKDFEMICLSPEAEKWLLDISLEMEKNLLPEFFESSLGEERLRAEFEEMDKFDLCAIDADATLSKPVWSLFFRDMK